MCVTVSVERALVQDYIAVLYTNFQCHGKVDKTSSYLYQLVNFTSHINLETKFLDWKITCTQIQEMIETNDSVSKIQNFKL